MQSIFVSTVGVFNNQSQNGQERLGVHRLAPVRREHKIAVEIVALQLPLLQRIARVSTV